MTERAGHRELPIVLIAQRNAQTAAADRIVIRHFLGRTHLLFYPGKLRSFHSNLGCDRLIPC